MHTRIFYGFLIATLFFSGCATHRGAHRAPSASILSPVAEEVALGEKIHAHILSSFYPYTEPAVVAYIQKIGTALAASAERKDLPYHFTILYNDKIYATSSPGGFIYLTTGLIHFLDNEAELAAVIAHEIGELQYQDPRLSRSRKILDAVTQGGAAVAPALGSIGVLATLGLVMVHAMAEAGDLTFEERIQRADTSALHYMVEAGFDPQGLIDHLYKFLNAGQEIIPFFYDYQQSRPITIERFQSLQLEFAKLSLEGKTFSTNRQVYQETTKPVHEIYSG